MITLIPKPKQIRMRRGAFLFTSDMCIFASKNVLPIAEMLRKELRAMIGLDLKCKEMKGVEESLQIGLNKEPRILVKPLTTIGNEGYFLTIRKEEITVSGITQASIFYGTRTLLQLMGKDLLIPCVEIQDWPSMEMRGVHLMPRNQMPTFDYFLSFIKRLSGYKINTILFEYEDKFPYEKHPVIRHPLALTRSQIARFLAVAKEHYIEVVPLLQYFAHVEYILCHKEYEHLRERSGDPYQYCVSRPESLALFQDLAREILDLHRESRYFHIGGDETYYMGECPACRKECDQTGKSKFFINHIRKAAGYISAAGKIPIIWDDQLAWYPEDIDSLPRDIRIMYWDYTTSDAKEVPYVKWDNRIWFGEEIFERVPADIIKLFRKYWDGGRFPESNKSFPYLRFYQDHGFKVIGAPASRCGGTGAINPNNQMHIPNIRGFAGRIAENKATGIVATSWSECGGPLESTWYGLVAAGAFSWNPTQSRTEFDQAFPESFFGNKDPSLTKAIYLMGGDITFLNASKMRRQTSQALDLFEKLRPRIKTNHLTLDYFILQCCMRLHFIRSLETFREIEEKIVRYLDYTRWKKEKQTGNQGSLSYLCPEEEQENFSRDSLRRMVGNLRNLRVELPALKKEVRDLFSLTVKKDDVDRMVASFYAEEEKKINSFLSELNYLLACHELEAYRDRGISDEPVSKKKKDPGEKNHCR
jgi:hypothetical protein